MSDQTDKLPSNAENKYPNLKGGSRKGIPNKINGDIKAMILEALDNKGGAAYLADQADKNPSAFMGLIGKVLPMTVASDPDNPLLSGVTISFK